MNSSDLQVGQLVRVGMRFEGGMRVGEGKMTSDVYTGKVFRVVAIRHSKMSGVTSAALAPSNLVGVDESDEVVDISCNRLEPIEGREAHAAIAKALGK